MEPKAESYTWTSPITNSALRLHILQFQWHLFITY